MAIPTERIGSFDTQLVEHFFQSLANTGGITLHIRKLAGANSHHIVEATFKVRLVPFPSLRMLYCSPRMLSCLREPAPSFAASILAAVLNCRLINTS